MNQTEYFNLLIKFRENSCTPAEKESLFLWLSDQKNEHQIKLFLQTELENFPSMDDQADEDRFKKMFSALESEIRRKSVGQKTSRIPVFRYIAVAASLILIFSLGIVSAYWWAGRQLASTNYTEIKAPLGTRSEVHLPDGSYVWLNAGSRIRYCQAFSKTDRLITLEGEAYFKVAKNKKIPFVVRSGDLSIEAVGTEFNVKAYKEERIIETTLIEGKVVVKRKNTETHSEQIIYLHPNQKAIYDSERLTVTNVDDSTRDEDQAKKAPEPGVLHKKTGIDALSAISWRENRLIVKGEPMGSLAIKLERKYNVSIHFSSEAMKNFKFTGTLEDETLQQTLDVIKLTAPIEYKLEGKNVTIFENPQMRERFIQHLKSK